MSQEGTSLREELYRVIEHYAELTAQARKGAVDPMGQIGKIVKKRIPFLLLVIKEIIVRFERDEITYEQGLLRVIREAQQYPDQEIVLDSRREIQEIESDCPAFVFALRWMDAKQNLRPSPQEIETVLNTLKSLNEKYRERYVPDGDNAATVIPYFLPPEEGRRPETSVARAADVVRRAILELHHLMIEHESSRSFLGFTRGTRKEIESDLVRLAWFLFRCGYSVGRIASGYYKDLLTDFLNEKILDFLIQDEQGVEALSGLSWHMAVMALMDVGGFFSHPNDYRDLDDRREVARQIKYLKSKHRGGSSLLKKISHLDKLYGARPQGRMARNFLRCRYYSAFGAYYGQNRYLDSRREAAIDLYKPLVDPAAMEQRAEEDLKRSGRVFSSKTQDEMTGLLKLVMDSLSNPERVKGKQVKILGDISSGAMGEVSIGIHQDRIVALKRVKSGVTSSLGDPMALLEYEAALNHRAQPDPQNQYPYVVEYYGIVEQEGEKLLINGYHPNDNLTQLVERNWQEKYKPPFYSESKITLATVQVIFEQFLDCLRRFRDKGVVHRDLKTDNILYMVDENEVVTRIKVIDFGVALALGPGAVDDLFRGKIVGTFSYMAPEQARGRAVFQSDLYSVGAIMTVILTGRLPLVFPRTKTREELVRQIARIEGEPRPKLVTLNSGLRRNPALKRLASIVEAMLALDPFKRPEVEQVEAAVKKVFDKIKDDKHKISVFYQRGT